MNRLFEELKHRNVFRVGIAYLALTWLIIQITSVAVPALNLPETLNSIVFYLGLIGFPFALLLAWAFELTPDGLKRSSDVADDASIRADSSRKLNYVVIGMLAWFGLAQVHALAGHALDFCWLCPCRAVPGNVGNVLVMF